MPAELPLRAPSFIWARAAADPDRLKGGGIDLWRIDLVRPEAEIARAAKLLSRDETERAERYRYDRHRARFILGRASLREIVAGYGGGDAAGLRIEVEPSGRPILVDGGGLVFSYSKTSTLAVLAVSWGGRLGVDIEEVAEKPDLSLIVEDQYSPDERRQIGALPSDRRLEAFYRGWTAKEALVKATGEGLTSLLPQITIDLEPNSAAQLLAGPAPYEPEVWRLAAFEAAPGILGAVALDRPIGTIKAIVR